MDGDLAERAAELTLAADLRSLDALHLAAALLLPEGVTLATWDIRLHRAAHRTGITTLPPEL